MAYMINVMLNTHMSMTINFFFLTPLLYLLVIIFSYLRSCFLFSRCVVLTEKKRLKPDLLVANIVKDKNLKTIARFIKAGDAANFL